MIRSSVCMEDSRQQSTLSMTFETLIESRKFLTTGPCATLCGATLMVSAVWHAEINGWSVSPRGAGYLFGSDIVKQFNRDNKIDLICWAHQLMMEGYKEMFKGTLVTVWSAPNYCYWCGNVAAILELDENLKTYYKIFEAAP
jgi:diadenosine tetraphosphatase ApaH/serine/threonine PP2A family protein phosphatase